MYVLKYAIDIVQGERTPIADSYNSFEADTIQALVDHYISLEEEQQIKISGVSVYINVLEQMVYWVAVHMFTYDF